jgi:phosphatidylglycerophosphate synthase
MEEVMRVVNISNFLTIIRLLCAPLIPLSLFFEINPLWLASDSSFQVGTFFFALILASTDFFDGFLARLLHQETTLGRRLEPIADFSYCLSMLVAVVIIYKDFPILLGLASFFSCYFVWYATNVALLRRQGKIVGSNVYAKRSVFALMTSMLLVIAGSFMWPSYIWHSVAISGIVISAILASKALTEYEIVAQYPTGRVGITK